MSNAHYWLAAMLMPGITPITFRRYLEFFPTIESLFSASRHDLTALGMHEKHIEPILNPDWKAVEKELAWLKGKNRYILSLQDTNYPSLLKETADPPLVLYVEGNLSALAHPQIAIVGTRKPSPAGVQNAEFFSKSLIQAGFAITSGLALGIDGAAHCGALKAKGITIGVAGTGLLHIYPHKHRALVSEILNYQGAVISEFPLNTEPQAYHFPRRNRIIAGLSLGVLVVEAAIKSGSLITARLAIEEGRDVFAIPGSIHHPEARGCHHLIKLGAKLVETPADIIDEVGEQKQINMSFEQTKNNDFSANLSYEQLQILNQIEYAVTAFDVILLRSGLTTGEVSSILLSLELQNYIQSVPGGYIRAVPTR